MEYGLLGEKLAHSFSPEIHGRLAAYEYILCPQPPNKVEGFIRARSFKGLNVTIPYKKQVMQYCDEVDERARRIGAANTLVMRAGKLLAFNTDYDGVVYTLKTHGIALGGKTLLILGSGGTMQTVAAVAADMCAKKVLVASRTGGEGRLTYPEAQQRADVQVVINCSPAGMYPHNGEKLIDLAAFPQLMAVMDAVYNPFSTALLQQARQLGAVAVNGLEMLVAQAAYASALFLDTPVKTDAIPEIAGEIYERLCNVTLLGMPGCGKTSIGKALAQKLGKKFVDVDAEIEKQAGMPIPQIFETLGEDAFRDLESEATARVAAGSGQVISTGGGVVKRAQNIAALRQNGPVVFIDCPVERLAMSDGRPLAKSRQDLEKLHGERHGLYTEAAHCRVEYHPYFPENLARVQNAYRQLVQKLP